MMHDDHELMQRFADGDDTAFDTLVRSWEPHVMRTAMRFVGHHAEAADVCQEVFLRVYHHREKYAPKAGAFATWLYCIVVNLIRDRNKRRRVECLRMQEDVVDDRSINPDQQIAARETSTIVTHAVSALPEPLQTVLILKHTSQLTFQQIGEVLGVPTSTVKSRLKRALITLGRELRNRGVNKSEIES